MVVLRHSDETVGLMTQSAGQTRTPRAAEWFDKAKRHRFRFLRQTAKKASPAAANSASMPGFGTAVIFGEPLPEDWALKCPAPLGKMPPNSKGSPTVKLVQSAIPSSLLKISVPAVTTVPPVNRSPHRLPGKEAPGAFQRKGKGIQARRRFVRSRDTPYANCQEFFFRGGGGGGGGPAVAGLAAAAG